MYGYIGSLLIGTLGPRPTSANYARDYARLHKEVLWCVGTYAGVHIGLCSHVAVTSRCQTARCQSRLLIDD